MGFFDGIKKATQPYDDEDDFFEGSDISLKSTSPAPGSEQASFESSFAAGSAPEPETPHESPKSPVEGGLLGALGVRKAAKPKAQQRERLVNFGGRESQVILFNPKTLDEAGELVNYLRQGRSVVMTLEGIPTDSARRLLDFLSGITYALQGKITPVSAKTYFVTPENVDILTPQTEQPTSDGQYF